MIIYYRDWLNFRVINFKNVIEIAFILAVLQIIYYSDEFTY